MTLTILIIDPDPRFAEKLEGRIKTTFKNTSFEIYYYTKLEAATEKLMLLKKIDMAFINLEASDHQGFKVYETYRKFAPPSPVVLLCDQYVDSIMSPLLLKGIQDYLVKSRLDEENITRLMEYAANRFRLQQKIDKMIGVIEEKSNDLIRQTKRLAKLIYDLKRPMVVAYQQLRTLEPTMLRPEEKDTFHKILASLQVMNVILDEAQDKTPTSEGEGDNFFLPAYGKVPQKIPAKAKSVMAN